MVPADLHDFIACYQTGRRVKREESEKFKRFSLETLLARDKVNLDIFWVKDHALDDPDLLPPPDEVAAEIVESLEMALDRSTHERAATHDLRRHDPTTCRNGARRWLKWPLHPRAVVQRPMQQIRGQQIHRRNDNSQVGIALKLSIIRRQAQCVHAGVSENNSSIGCIGAFN